LKYDYILINWSKNQS